MISLGTLHNLRLFELETAVGEIERVGANKYIMVEGYRNVAEMHNLECWALTAESILHTAEWIWLYQPVWLHRRLRIHLLRVSGPTQWM